MEKPSCASSDPKVHDSPAVPVNDGNGASELEPQGLHVGAAPFDSSPARSAAGPTENAKAIIEPLGDKALTPSSTSKSFFVEGTTEKNLAFLEFKHNIPEGLQCHYFLKGRRLELKEKRQYMRALSGKMKQTKREIHEIRCLLEAENEENRNGEELRQCLLDSIQQEDTENRNDEELRQRLQFAKAEYQQSCEDFQEVKGNIQKLRKEIMDCQECLLQSFFKWYKGGNHLQDVTNMNA